MIEPTPKDKLRTLFVVHHGHTHGRFTTVAGVFTNQVDAGKLAKQRNNSATYINVSVSVCELDKEMSE